MKTVALPIKHTRVLAFWIMTPLLVACFIAYIYFVNAAIVHIVDRKQVEAESRAVAAHISELENEYYSLRSEITPEYALAQGFIESDSTLFAVRDTYSGLAKLGE